MKHLIILSFINFSSNAIVMVFEIIGIRILAPYVGASIITWSSLIVIILFFLSLGNYYGGKYADKGANIGYFQNIFFLTTIILLIEYIYKDFLLEASYLYVDSIWYYVIGVSILLFGPVSYCLGMIAPITMKLAIDDLESTGNKVGWISGIGSFGAIFGTMIAGFILIPYMGISIILWSLGLYCLGLSILCFLLQYKFISPFIKILYSLIFITSIYLFILLKI